MEIVTVACVKQASMSNNPLSVPWWWRLNVHRPENPPCFSLAYYLISLPQSPKVFKSTLNAPRAVFFESTRDKTSENARRARRWMWKVDILFAFWSLSEHLDTKPNFPVYHQCALNIRQDTITTMMNIIRVYFTVRENHYFTLIQRMQDGNHFERLPQIIIVTQRKLVAFSTVSCSNSLFWSFSGPTVGK